MSDIVCRFVSPRWFRAAILGGVLLAVGACQTLQPQSNASPETAEMAGLQRTLLQSARESEAGSEYEKASALYAKLVDHWPDSPEFLGGFARNMRYTGNSKSAVQFVEQKGSHLLGDPGVKFEYAKALLATGRVHDALTHMNQVVEMTPQDWKVYSAIGVANDNIGKYDVALSAYDEALRLAPDNPVVLNNKAMSQALAGHLSAAIRTLKRAAELDRRNPSIRQNLALLYAINGDLESAKALAAMDLDVDDLETNLSFYRRFEGGRQ